MSLLRENLTKGYNAVSKGVQIGGDISLLNSFSGEQDSDESAITNVEEATGIGTKALGDYSLEVGKKLVSPDTGEAIKGTFGFAKREAPKAVKESGLIEKGLQKMAPKLVTETTSKALSLGGSVLGAVGGVASVVGGINDLTKVNEDGVDKANKVVSIAAGAGSAMAGTAAAVGALTSTAVSNIWNPVGWISGIAAVGTAAFGIGKKLWAPK